MTEDSDGRGRNARQCTDPAADKVRVCDRSWSPSTRGLAAHSDQPDFAIMLSGRPSPSWPYGMASPGSDSNSVVACAKICEASGHGHELGWPDRRAAGQENDEPNVDIMSLNM